MINHKIMYDDDNQSGKHDFSNRRDFVTGLDFVVSMSSKITRIKGKTFLY
jgi:hypothetical protein